jgi:hypothetical protein
LIENSIKIIDNYLLSIKLVIDNQKKSMKIHFYQQSTEKVKYCYLKPKKSTIAFIYLTLFRKIQRTKGETAERAT